MVACFEFSFLGWYKVLSYYLWREIVRYRLFFEMSVLVD